MNDSFANLQATLLKRCFGFEDPFGEHGAIAAAVAYAVLAATRSAPQQSPYAVGLDAVRCMPANAMQFHLGIACGMAMTLFTVDSDNE